MPMNRAICERCGKEFSPPWFGAASRLCPQCRKEEEGPRVMTMADVDAASRPVLSMTTVIVGVNVAVFIGMALSGVSLTEPTGRQLLAWGANFGPLTLGAQPWRALTHMFVHAGIFHIAFNMWALWNLGKLGERLFSRPVFAIVYLLCGLGSALASLAWHPATISVGASGAIFGMAGVLLSYLRLKHVGLPGQYLRRILGSLLTFVVYNLIFGAAIPFIDNAAHVGGLVTGLVLGALLPRPALRDEIRSPLRYLGIPLVAALILLGGWGLEHRDSGDIELAAGMERSMAGDYDAAIPHLEKAVRALPDDARARQLLADAYIHQHRYVDAAPQLARAAELDPQDSWTHLSLGFTYYHLDRLDDAKTELQKAVALKPGDPAAHFYLGLLYLDREEYAPAIAELQKTLELDPQYEEARKPLAEAQAGLQKQPAPAGKTAAPPRKTVPHK